MPKPREQYERTELARKRFEAAQWMRNHNIERCDLLPHNVATQQAADAWHRELLLLMHMEARTPL